MKSLRLPSKIVTLGALLIALGCSAPSNDVEEDRLATAEIPSEEIQSVDPRLLVEIRAYAAKWDDEYTSVIMADFLEESGKCQVLLSESSYYWSEKLASHFILGDRLVALYDTNRSCFDLFLPESIHIGNLNAYESFEVTDDPEPYHPVYRLIQFEPYLNNFLILNEMMSG